MLCTAKTNLAKTRKSEHRGNARPASLCVSPTCRLIGTKILRRVCQGRGVGVFQTTGSQISYFVNTFFLSADYLISSTGEAVFYLAAG